MSSDILNGAAMQPLPRAGDIHHETVGTSSTAAIDLFDVLGVSSNQTRVRVSVECSAQAYIVSGDSSVVAATTSHKRLAANSPRFYFVAHSRRWVRLIADAAATDVEFTLG